jgi:hypothetical protein
MNNILIMLALSALSTSIGAQEVPTIGIIDLYGLRSISEDQVRAVLPFSEGFVVPTDNSFAEEQVESDMAAALNVFRVEFSLVCCYEALKGIAYVGIEESPASELQFREEPTGNTKLLPEIVETQRQIEIALITAVNAGDSGEDISQGHSLLMNGEVRALQEKNIKYANEYFDLLTEVMNNSATQRDLAATVLSYASDKKAVVPYLQAAVLDPDEEVRNNATRALSLIAAFANQHPELDIEIDAEVFVDMLNSVWFGDRNKASAVLMQLTESRDPTLMQLIRDKALPSLIEMCRWHWRGHSFVPCKLLERAIGLPEQKELRSKNMTINAALELLRKQNTAGESGQ